jgi:hypothetical protein
MTTQTTNTTTSTGKNRGARKGAAQSNPKANIGSHMQGKDQTPAIKTVGQKTDAKVAPPDKKTVIEAQKIVHGFRKANDELVTIKKQAEAQRGGLSDIVFRIVLLGWNKVDNKAHAWVFCRALLDSAELAERVQAKKAEKLDEVPTARTVLGASWQTYKSQILKCLAIGLDPTQFKNGTDYRSAASKIKPAAGRPARQTSGRKAAAETAAQEDLSSLRTEAQAAIVEFTKVCSDLDESDQLVFANKLHELTKAAKAMAETTTEAEDVGEQAAVASM